MGGAVPKSATASTPEPSSKSSLSATVADYSPPPSTHSPLVRSSQTTISVCLLGMDSDRSVPWTKAHPMTIYQPVGGCAVFLRQLKGAYRWEYHSTSWCFCSDDLHELKITDETESKVDDFKVEVFVEEYVLCFDVSMSDFHFVEILGGLDNLFEDEFGLLLWKSPFCFAFHVLLEWISAPILHH